MARQYRRDITEEQKRAENRERNRKWRATHPGKAAAASKKYYYSKRSAEEARARALEDKYGLPLEGYEFLLEKQQGVCAICHQPETNGRALSVDHCHKTGIIRALLCHRCNRLLGFARDDPELLEAAAIYLRTKNVT